MNLRKLVASFALTLALLPSLVAQQPAEFRIGTWNIEFLGAAPHLRRDTPPRTDDDVQKIGAKIRELGVCVLGVQEICGEAPLKQVCAAAGDTWAYVLGTSGSWSDGKTQQGIGFVYDTAQVELLHAEELNDFPSERDGLPVFHRKPVTACFRHRKTGCDFRAIVVHLKAGKKDKDQAKRRVEATVLRGWLDQLLAKFPREDRDVVVLGDFNCTYGDEPEAIFEVGGAMQYLDQQEAAPTILWFDEPIDQIVVGRGFDEVDRRSRAVHGVAGEAARDAWRRTYSDHFPVTVTLRAAGDDDPSATFAHGPNAQHLPVDRRAPAKAAPGPGANVAGAFAVGDAVQIIVQDAVVEGTLLAPLPEGPGGWVVVRSNTQIDDAPVIAIPLHEVRRVIRR